jgi:hypothetical protein
MTQAEAATPRAFTRGALTWAAACCLAAIPVALAASGALAAVAVVLGAATMGLAVSSLARLLEGMLHARPSRARLRALVGAALRWPLVAAGLAASLWVGVPAGWLLVGVTAWPLALLIEGLRAGTRADAVMPQA